jgi:hypothetical protein
VCAALFGGGVAGPMTFLGGDGRGCHIQHFGPPKASATPFESLSLPATRAPSADDEETPEAPAPVKKKSLFSLHPSRKETAKHPRATRKHGIFASIRHWVSKRLRRTSKNGKKKAWDRDHAKKRHGKERKQAGLFEPSVGQKRGPRVAKKGKQTGTVRRNLDAATAQAKRMYSIGHNGLFAGGRARSSADGAAQAGPAHESA